MTEFDLSGFRKLPRRTLYRPDGQSACPCGSGASFRSCCRDHLPGFTNKHALRDALRAGDLDAALTAARADVGQYVIWHRTNTVPLLREAHPVGRQFLDVDLKALADMVETLCEVHWRSKRSGPLMAVLERLRDAISSPVWNRKITYFQALTEHVANDDDRAARRELDKVLPLSNDEDDVALLQLYMSLYADTLSFSKIIALCGQIVRSDPSLANQLQYGAIAAIRYFLIGDAQQAKDELERIVAVGRAAQAKHDLSAYETWLMASGVGFLGLLSRKASLNREAIDLLNGELAAGAWTADGAASLHRQIADNHRYIDQWAEAEAAYRRSLAEAPSPGATIFLAESVMLQGRALEAAAILDPLEPAGMDRPEHEDFAFVTAAIAVELGDRDQMQRAVRLLEGFESTAPYFERRRLVFLLRVTQALRTGSSPKIKRSLRRWLAVSARGLSRYFVLEPNINGLGLNLNNLLNDLADRLDERGAPGDDQHAGPRNDTKG